MKNRVSIPAIARIAAVAAAIVIATLAAGAGTAKAAWGDYGYTVGGNVRACAGWCAVVAWARPGWLRVYCWRDGDWTAGSPRWFYVGRQGEQGQWFGGFVHSSLVPVQPSVPRC